MLCLRIFRGCSDHNTTNSKGRSFVGAEVFMLCRCQWWSCDDVNAYFWSLRPLLQSISPWFASIRPTPQWNFVDAYYYGAWLVSRSIIAQVVSTGPKGWTVLDAAPVWFNQWQTHIQVKLFCSILIGQSRFDFLAISFYLSFFDSLVGAVCCCWILNRYRA